MTYQVVVLAWRRRVSRLLLGLGSCVAMLLLGPAAFGTGSVTLAWNPSTSANIASYKIYYGMASQAYTQSVPVAGSTNVVITGLTENITYYFAATAVDSSGNESPFSNETSYSVPATAMVATNLPPTLNPLSNLAVNENSGPKTVTFNGVTSGVTNPVTLVVTAISSNPGLIPDPTVNYTSPNGSGTLSFTPAANQFGAATISVTVNNGMPGNNLVTRSFVVTVSPVNQPPTLDPLGAISINENAALQTVNLSGITSGAANETQVLTVTAVSGSPSLIPNPKVAYASPNTTGSLTFTAATNSYGTATITVTVNDGGASNNMVTQSFGVTVNPLAGSPTLNPVPNLVVVAGVKQTVNLAGISSGSTSGSITVKALSSNTQIVPQPLVVYRSPGSTGSLNLTPQTAGTAIVSVTVNSASGKVIQTFSVTVLPAGSTPPKITGQSTNQVAMPGQTVKLSVAATGTSPLKYQWQCNSCILASATNAVLNLSIISTNQAGVYKVTISNSLGTTNSTATLSVYPNLAAFLAPATPPSRGQFALTINGVAGFKYVVQASSNLVNWTSVKTNVAPFTFVETNANRFVRRYYRSFYLP